MRFRNLIGTFATVPRPKFNPRWAPTQFYDEVEPEAGVWVTTENRAIQDLEWLVYYRVVEQDQELVIAEMRVVPAPRSEKEDRWLTASFRRPEARPRSYTEPRVPPGGLRARQLRSAIHTGKAIARARSEAGGWRDLLESKGVTDDSWRPFSDQALEAPRRVGRRGRSDRYYAKLAARYVAALEDGSTAPVAAVAEQLGEGYSGAYVRDALHRARGRGLLTRPQRGRAGGQLTDKALKALALEREEKSS